MKINSGNYKYIISVNNIFRHFNYEICQKEADIENIIKGISNCDLYHFDFNIFYINVFDSEHIYKCTYGYIMAKNVVFIQGAEESLKDIAHNNINNVNKDDMLISFESVKADIEAYLTKGKALLLDHLLATTPQFFTKFRGIVPLDDLVGIINNIGREGKDVDDYFKNYQKIYYSQYKLNLNNSYTAKFKHKNNNYSMSDSWLDYYNSFNLEVSNRENLMATFSCRPLSENEFEIDANRTLDIKKNKKMSKILDLLNKRAKDLDSVFASFFKAYKDDVLIRSKFYISNHVSRLQDCLAKLSFSEEEQEDFYNKLIGRLE